MPHRSTFLTILLIILLIAVLYFIFHHFKPHRPLRGGTYTSTILDQDYRDMIDALNEKNIAKMEHIKSIPPEVKSSLQQSYTHSIELINSYNETHEEDLIPIETIGISISEALVAFYIQFKDVITFKSILGKGNLNVAFDIETKDFHNCVLRVYIGNDELAIRYLEGMRLVMDPTKGFLPKIFYGAFMLPHNPKKSLNERHIKWEIMQKYTPILSSDILKNVQKHMHLMIDILRYVHSRNAKYFDWKYNNFGKDKDNTVLLDTDFVDSLEGFDSASTITHHSTDDWVLGNDINYVLQYRAAKNNEYAKLYDKCCLLHEYICISNLSKKINEKKIDDTEKSIAEEYKRELMLDIELKDMISESKEYAKGDAKIKAFIEEIDDEIKAREKQITDDKQKKEDALKTKRQSESSGIFGKINFVPISSSSSATSSNASSNASSGPPPAPVFDKKTGKWVLPGKESTPFITTTSIKKDE